MQSWDLTQIEAPEGTRSPAKSLDSPLRDGKSVQDRIADNGRNQGDLRALIPRKPGNRSVKGVKTPTKGWSVVLCGAGAASQAGEGQLCSAWRSPLGSFGVSLG